MDFSEAFDTVDDNILKQDWQNTAGKTTCQGDPSVSRSKGFASAFRSVTKSVPQGSVPGPVLFIM